MVPLIAPPAQDHDSKPIHAQGTTDINNNNLCGEDNNVDEVDNVTEEDKDNAIVSEERARHDENRA